jgi:putative CocE/NonD family hydrolase
MFNPRISKTNWMGVLLSAALVASYGANGKPARESASSDEGQHVPVPLPGAPGEGMIIQKNVMVRMRDGVRLATDIYRPAAHEKFPVVLIRTPFGKQVPDYKFLEKAKFYVKHGYVFAIQDIRGKYDSEGNWNGPRSEAHDGSDTITWLGTRAWSSGKVGMTGGSYLGLVQDIVADQENPYLKALVPMVSPLTLGREDLTEYDRLSTYTGRDTYSINAMEEIATDGRVTQDDRVSPAFNKAWDYLPRIDYPKIFGREMPDWSFLLTHQRGFWEEYLIRAAYGEWNKPLPEVDAWWKNYKEHYRKVNVPMLQITGWYDCCGEAMIKVFQLVRKYATDPVARSNQQLVIGPWFHALGQNFGDLDFGPQAKFDPDEVSVEWFDHWLKGEDNGVEKRAPVRVFVMGENRWQDATDWPIPGTQFTNYYLHSNGSAHLAQDGGQLSTEIPGNEPVDHYTYDPGNPTAVPMKAGLGPTDMTEVEKRDDVLIYTTDSLKAPVEVMGPLTLEFYVATSAPSTDFLVRLIDVYPDGKAYNLSNGGVPPYRTYWSKNVETTADGTRIVKANIILYPTGDLFAVGHRIRVEISSSWMSDGSKFGLPKFGARGLNVEPGTEPYATKWNVAHQTIYHDSAHPSHIVLPVTPR